MEKKWENSEKVKDLVYDYMNVCYGLNEIEIYDISSIAG
jgi:hypothetical protein